MATARASTTSDDTERNPSAAASTLSRVLVSLAVLGAGILMALVAVALVPTLLTPWARERIIDDARARGIVLQPGEVHLSWSRLSASDADFRFEGVEGVSGRIGSLVVEHDWFSPERAHIKGIDIRITAPAPNVALDFSRWSQRHTAVRGTIVDAKTVSWIPGDGNEPWLEIHGGTLQGLLDDNSVTFSAPRGAFLDSTIQAIQAQWRGAGLKLSFGTPGNKLRLSLRTEPEASTTGVATLKEMPVAALGRPFDASWDVDDDVVVSGTAHLELSPGADGPATGRLHLDIGGYDVPRLAGLGPALLGDEATLALRYSIAGDDADVVMKRARLEASVLTLTGSGTVDRQGTASRVELELQGAVDCEKLTRQVARLALRGSDASAMWAELAAQQTTGQLVLGLTITGNLQQPSRLRFDPTFRRSCGFVGG